MLIIGVLEIEYFLYLLQTEIFAFFELNINTKVNAGLI